MKFLVIRFSSIGDIVLTTPAIRCLKQQVPDAEVHLLTKQSMKAVTEANPYIDQFFYYHDNLRELIGQLKAERYDCVIDLHKNFRSYRIRWALQTKTLSYKKLSIEKFLLTKFHINFMPKRHIVDRCLDAVSSLGVKNDGGGLDYFIPEDQTVALTDLPITHLNGYIALVIGASYFTKKLPAVKLQQLCSSLHYPVILVGGKEDRTEGDWIAAADPTHIYNACGQFSLHGSAELVRKAQLVISHDTGLQYIACAFKKPVLALWGGTSPLLDVEPYYGDQQNSPGYTNFVVPGLRCQPCSNYGLDACPKGHFKCMQLQDIDAISKTARLYLG
ncbi:MAG: glycosyltransferase family 9 protein [Sediminibacterium sp.]